MKTEEELMELLQSAREENDTATLGASLWNGNIAEYAFRIKLINSAIAKAIKADDKRYHP